MKIIIGLFLGILLLFIYCSCVVAHWADERIDTLLEKEQIKEEKYDKIK
ncbi:MAG: hypothetical protein J6X28_02820 [Bacilli bacterium]|nr:hypothetical protein [Bacilli bacterium]